MGKITGFLAVAAATITSQIAFAQTDPRQVCPMCRAQYLFKTCDTVSAINPPKGSIVLVGEVVEAASLSPCWTKLSIALKQSSKHGLPSPVQVNVGFCTFWAGKVGDVITALVSEPTEPNPAAYEIRICPLRADNNG